LVLGDELLYAAAALFPLIVGGCLYVFARHRRAAKTRAGWRPIIGGNSLVLLLMLSILFLIGESFYRFVYDATDSFSQTRTSQRWFDRHFETNNAQVRDNENYIFNRRSSRPRFTFIGDSFTAGHGIANVEDRFTNRIRGAKRGAWEVHVFADVGRDTGEEIKLIPSLLQYNYDFDHVVLVYCLNDINDIVPQQQRIGERSSQPNRQPGFLVQHSFLINTYYFRLRARFDPEVSQYYDFVRAAYDGPIWEQQQERLKQFRDSCHNAGGRFSVVIFPFMHSLGPDNPYKPAHERLDHFCRENEVPYLDLLPTFEAHAGENLTVNRYDAHPNERAHAIAADAIREFLESQL
jgi:hypothetical protein